MAHTRMFRRVLIEYADTIAGTERSPELSR